MHLLIEKPVNRLEALFCHSTSHLVIDGDLDAYPYRPNLSRTTALQNTLTGYSRWVVNPTLAQILPKHTGSLVIDMFAVKVTRDKVKLLKLTHGWQWISLSKLEVLVLSDAKLLDKLLKRSSAYTWCNKCRNLFTISDYISLVYSTAPPSPGSAGRGSTIRALWGPRWFSDLWSGLRLGSTFNPPFSTRSIKKRMSHRSNNTLNAWRPVWSSIQTIQPYKWLKRHGSSAACMVKFQTLVTHFLETFASSDTIQSAVTFFFTASWKEGCQYNAISFNAEFNAMSWEPMHQESRQSR